MKVSNDHTVLVLTPQQAALLKDELVAVARIVALGGRVFSDVAHVTDLPVLHTLGMELDVLRPDGTSVEGGAA